MNIAILGAQGSGKTQLANDLSQRLSLPAAGTNTVKVEIADAPALMTAVYCDLLKNDPTLYESALAQHKIYAFTLVCALDIDCGCDKQTSGGSGGREAVDARLRVVLTRNKIAYAVIYGQGPARVDAALRAISCRQDVRIAPITSRQKHWQWSCEKCSDPACERRLFTDQLKTDNSPT